MENLQQSWILPALIAIPFISGFLCWLVEKMDSHLPRWIALGGMTLTFILTLMLWQQGDFGKLLITDGMADKNALPWTAQFLLPWIPSFGINFHLALDGLALLMVSLTAFSWHYGGWLFVG